MAEWFNALARFFDGFIAHAGSNPAPSTTRSDALFIGFKVKFYSVSISKDCPDYR